MEVDGVSPYEKAQNERVAELHAKFRRQFPDFEMETQALSYSKKQLTMVLNVALQEMLSKTSVGWNLQFTV